ncbi:acyl-CoA thioesterase [Hydrocarboniphaga effusa]|jgi:acyl-CoA thioesterase FadM|uniref:acyl-CoA thioesterase n=1 Tax=Hydrocarboniphaga effusa TaxID=243629 RepID=UPI00398C107E
MLDDRTPPRRVTKLHHVRPCDIDAWGHLNHAKAIELFELGRHDWVRARQSAERGYGCLPVVVRIDVSYRREVFLSEVLVTTELTQTKYYTAEFTQAISLPHEADSPAIAGRISISFLDTTTRRPMRVQGVELLKA